MRLVVPDGFDRAPPNLGRDYHAAKDADHTSDATGAGFYDEAVQPVLGQQRVAHGRRTERGADDSPAQISAFGERFENRRLMGAVECADADVDNASLERA